MKGTFFIASQSALWLVSALLLLVVPGPLLGFFGGAAAPFTQVLARLFGAELTGLALASFFTRATADKAVRRALFSSYIVCNSLGFAVTLWATLSGIFAFTGWLLVVLYLVYAAGFTALRLSATEDH